MNGIRVIQAVYGVQRIRDGKVEGVRDVTALVQQFADQGKFTFKADTATLAGNKDPAPGNSKHFAMNYTFGPSRYTFACKENETVTIDPPGNLRVIGAAYGTVNPKDTDNRSKDVTAIVQQMLDNGTRSFKPTNKLFGDPFDGPRKNFGMVYVSALNTGVRKAVASDQDGTVEVSP
jgi:hypothetical protein